MWKRVLLAVGIASVTIMSFGAGWVIGRLTGDEAGKYRRFEHERQEIAKILVADPGFKNVEIEMFTADGSAYLTGQVPRREDYNRLRVSLESTYWKSRMDEMTRCVSHDH